MAADPGTISTPDAFGLADNEAYALTDIGTFNVAEFLLTKLEPINLDELESADRECTICHHEFRTSGVVKHEHTPVKTPCGHIFGQKCIIKWLQPMNFWGLKDESHTEPAENLPWVHGKTSCPMCRVEFFPPFQVEPMELVAQRLFLWDIAYGHARVRYTDRERYSRRILWDFVEYCHSMDELEHNAGLARGYAKQEFVRWLRRLRDRNLTERQNQLRENLKRYIRDAT